MCRRTEKLSHLKKSRWPVSRFGGTRLCGNLPAPGLIHSMHAWVRWARARGLNDLVRSLAARRANMLVYIETPRLVHTSRHPGPRGGFPRSQYERKSPGLILGPPISHENG